MKITGTKGPEDETLEAKVKRLKRNGKIKDAYD